MNWYLLANLNFPGLIAAADSLPSLPAPAQYGILGIAVAVLATGKVVVPVGWLRDEQKARARAEERADRYEAEVKRLNDSFSEKAIPALVESSKAMVSISEVTHDLLRDRGRG